MKLYAIGFCLLSLDAIALAQAVDLNVVWQYNPLDTPKAPSVFT
jgi:hypothetical protein